MPDDQSMQPYDPYQTHPQYPQQPAYPEYQQGMPFQQPMAPQPTYGYPDPSTQQMPYGTAPAPAYGMVAPKKKPSGGMMAAIIGGTSVIALVVGIAMGVSGNYPERFKETLKQYQDEKTQQGDGKTDGQDGKSDDQGDKTQKPDGQDADDQGTLQASGTGIGNVSKVPIAEGKFTVEGKEYMLLQSTAADFLADGWQLSDYDKEQADADGNLMVAPDDDQFLVFLEKPEYDTSLSLFLRNSTEQPVNYDQCLIESIIVDRLMPDESAPSLVIPGDVKVGMSKDEVIAVYGEPQDIYSNKMNGFLYESVIYSETEEGTGVNAGFTFNDGILTEINYGIY